MNSIDFSINKINELKKKSLYIKTYPSNPITILKGMGNVIGEIDNQHIEFLKITNGASILDYCFWGFKNPKLYPRNIYEEMMEVWYSMPLTSSIFWCIAGSGNGDYFGYLAKKNSNNNHYIGYLDTNNPEEIILVSSSFNIFIKKFILAIEEQINKNKDLLDIDYDSFFKKENLIHNDPELEEWITNGNTIKINLLTQSKLLQRV